MKGFFSLFRLSAKEIFGEKKRTTIINLVLCSMLIALSMVVEALSIDMPFGKINFAFIPLAAIGIALLYMAEGNPGRQGQLIAVVCVLPTLRERRRRLAYFIP